MGRVIAVGIQKGGTGKSTTAVNLAAGLTLKKRVLLIDLDPQANATEALLADLSGTEGAGAYQLLQGTKKLDDLVRPVSLFLDIVPSHINVARLEPTLSGSLDAYRLKEALVGSEYDYVIIDCPPSLGALMTNALAAATDVLVPVKPATFGLSAVHDFMETLAVVQQRLNPDLKLLGILITLFDGRTVIARDAVDYLVEQFGSKVLETRIRVNVQLDEAASAQKSIFDFDPRSRGAEDYALLAMEVHERVGIS